MKEVTNNNQLVCTINATFITMALTMLDFDLVLHEETWPTPEELLSIRNRCHSMVDVLLDAKETGVELESFTEVSNSILSDLNEYINSDKSIPEKIVNSLGDVKNSFNKCIESYYI